MITQTKSYYYFPKKDKTISLINENQTTYKVIGKIKQTSKNKIYVGVTKDNNTEEKPEFVLKLFKIDEDQRVEDFMREKSILDIFQGYSEIIQYENPINLYLQNNEFILIPMKFYKNTDLSTHLYFDKSFKFTEEFIKQISYDILCILKLLKSRSIVHNDIKFENFLLGSENPLKLVTTDFETSEIISKNEKSTLFGGTDVFSAPEFLRNEPHDYSSDLWSFAANLYFAFSKEYPFQIKCSDNRSVILKKIETKKLVRPLKISNEAWELISKILVIDPNNRITVENALNLKWFNNIEIKQKQTVNSYASNASSINFSDEVIQN